MLRDDFDNKNSRMDRKRRVSGFHYSSEDTTLLLGPHESGGLDSWFDICMLWR